jgi:hypothetical protein
MAHLYMIYDDLPIKHGDFPVRVNVEGKSGETVPKFEVYQLGPVLTGMMYMFHPQSWLANGMLYYWIYTLFFRGKSCY